MRLKKRYFGRDCFASKLKQILQFYSPHTLFLLHGKSSFENADIKFSLNKVLKELNIHAIHFFDFEKNPRIEDVIKGAALLKESEASLVLAIGGGSVLDMAKMVNVFSEQSNNLALNLQNSKTGITTKAKPLIAVPTTAGTGSEATHFSVLYIQKKKFSIAHPYMMPDHVIIDPALTKSMSPYLAATTAFDAFTQAIESFWAVNATPKSQRYARYAMQLCTHYLRESVENPESKARDKMVLAAYFAGKAIDISKTTAPHALSYALTMNYDIPHGHAVALNMPIFMKINANCNEHNINGPRGKIYHERTMRQLLDILNAKDANACAHQFITLMKQVGLASDFKAFGIHEKHQFQALVNSVNLERMQNNPIKICPETLLTKLTSVSEMYNV